MIGKKILSTVSIVVMASMTVPSFCFGAVFAEESGEVATHYNLYFGDLHSHTSYSDGEGTPDQAYETAQSAEADFLAITDHHYLLLEREWADILRSANDHTSSSFVALAGYEYFLPGINELNVYGTPNMPPDAGLTPKAHYEGDRMTGGSFFPWIYDWIAAEPGAVGQWNHPLSYGCPVCWDYYQFDFLTGERDMAMGMIEVYNSYIRESSYILALDQGWHMMPTATGDTHTTDWIAGCEMRTVLLAPALTEQDLLDAMRAGRGYATLDSNLRITYTVNGEVMGSVLGGGSSFDVVIHIEDRDGVSSDAITLVEIVSDGGEVVASLPGNGSTVFDWSDTLESDDASYYYLRVSTESNELGVPGVTAWTAPVWTGS